MSEFYSVKLTADELLKLDGFVRPEVQATVDLAKHAASLSASGMTEAQRKFVAEIVAEAKENGLLIWRHTRLRYCAVCGKSGDYAPYKSGRNRGLPNYNKPRDLPGVDLASRFVRIQGHAAQGACSTCINDLMPGMVQELSSVRAQLPDQLARPGYPRFRRWDKARCTKCEWSGHEGQLVELPALFGGQYRGKCPACGAENKPFGPPLVENTGLGHEVVEC